MMNVLAELHQEQDLKLNLKFEIEVLCKSLSIDINVSNCVINVLYSLLIQFFYNILFKFLLGSVS